jgi:proteasome alpha subunit
VGHEQSEIYRIQYDGSISDHRGFCVIGGSEEELKSQLSSGYRPALPLGEVLRLGHRALGRAVDGKNAVTAENLEVCVLEKARIGRKFRRLDTDELRQHLSG